MPLHRHVVAAVCCIHDHQVILNDMILNDQQISDVEHDTDDDDDDPHQADDQNVNAESVNQQMEAEGDDGSVSGDLETARRSTRANRVCLQTDWHILPLLSSINGPESYMLFVEGHMTNHYQLIAL
jgi:hypothetical protein